MLQCLAVTLRVHAIGQLRHLLLPAGWRVGGDVMAGGRGGGDGGWGGVAGPVAAHVVCVHDASLMVLVLVPLQQQV